MVASIVKPWSRRQWAWRLAGLTAIGLAAWAVAERVAGPRVPLAQVVQRDFVQTVVATGRVESPHRVDLGAQITGTVQQVRVAEGDAVEAGAVLVALDDLELRATLQQAERAVDQARARVRQLREVQEPTATQAVAQARANHEATRQALTRQQELLARGFVGQQAVDEAQRAEQVTAAQWRSAEQAAAGLRPGGSDTVLAQASLDQAQASAEVARARLRYARVTAPVAGTVIGRKVEPGDVVQAGRLLVTLSPSAPAGATQLIVQVDEKNLHLLQVGQRAQASADAFATQRFAAEVGFIHPAVDAQRGAVEVRLRVPEPPPTLQQNMTVSVDIEVARRALAVLVPAEAVRDGQGAQPWALKWVAGRAQRQPLRTGLRSEGWVEVLEGLRPGDHVIPALGAAAAVADGDRVRGP